MRPLYDALFDMTDMERGHAARSSSGVIEIAPLAFMRGRTLNDSFIILDEAQNTTPEQMKMFLTRLGFGSKMVVTGDVTQRDLPRGVSGLKARAPHPRGHRRHRVLRLHRQRRASATPWWPRIVSAYDERRQKGVRRLWTSRSTTTTAKKTWRRCRCTS